MRSGSAAPRLPVISQSSCAGKVGTLADFDPDLDDPNIMCPLRDTLSGPANGCPVCGGSWAWHLAISLRVMTAWRLGGMRAAKEQREQDGSTR